MYSRQRGQTHEVSGLYTMIAAASARPPKKPV
jgi:hypothetical protein